MNAAYQGGSRVLNKRWPDSSLLGSPHWWRSGSGEYPVGGMIDSVMREFKNKRVGFDVVGSPFGALREDQLYYSAGHPNTTLSTFCDGYIFQKRLKDYEGVTVDETFITEGNLQEAIKIFLTSRRENT